MRVPNQPSLCSREVSDMETRYPVQVGIQMVSTQPYRRPGVQSGGGSGDAMFDLVLEGVECISQALDQAPPQTTEARPDTDATLLSSAQGCRFCSANSEEL